MKKVKNTTKVTVSNITTKLNDIREYLDDLAYAAEHGCNRTDAKSKAAK